MGEKEEPVKIQSGTSSAEKICADLNPQLIIRRPGGDATTAGQGALVVCLLPARTDTRWWQDYARRGHVWFQRGRLKFGHARNAAPFPSAIVTFGRYFSL